MGCNSSKRQDVNKSRERVPPTPEKGKGKGKGQTRAMDTPDYESENAGTIVVQSYSDERQLEADAFKSILDKTSRNLIDVTQTAPRVSGDLVAGRTAKYKAVLQRVVLPERGRKGFSDNLPSASASTESGVPVAAGNVEVAAAGGSPTRDVDEASAGRGNANGGRNAAVDVSTMAKSIAKRIAVGSAMVIEDCGDLLVPFAAVRSHAGPTPGTSLFS